MLDATVFPVSMRIHQPVLFTLATLVLVTVVVVVVFCPCADEAPTLTNAPKRATAATELTHCLLVFICLCFSNLSGFVKSVLAPNEKKMSAWIGVKVWKASEM